MVFYGSGIIGGLFNKKQRLRVAIRSRAKSRFQDGLVMNGLTAAFLWLFIFLMNVASALLFVLF